MNAVETIIERCREAAEWLPVEALEHARRRRPELRGFAVFPVYAPVEIIHAAGLLPVGLFGSGGRVPVTHADSRFQSFICSIAKSSLELFLADPMKGFEGAVFSSICDVARNLASLVRRNRPDLCVEYLHLPQNPADESSLAYTRAEFDRFRRSLADHLQRPIDDSAIAESLALYNRVRSQIRTLYDLRRQRPGCIGAGDLAAVVRASTRLMPDEFLELVGPLIEDVRHRQVRPRDCVPVVLEGAFCEQPPIGLLGTIEAAGCQVRDDDLAIGWRLFTEDVVPDSDPLAALAAAYLHRSSYTSVRHDPRQPRTLGLLNRMKAGGAEAVLFAPAKFCEPALLDYVLFRRVLDDRNVPHLKLEFEEKMWTFESSRTEVETFVESMLFD